MLHNAVYMCISQCSVAVISMEQTSYSVVEGTGAVQVCIELVSGDLQGVNATVQLATQSDSASNSS